MTIEQLCCVCVGLIVEAVTFALGILVGAALRRKEPNLGEAKCVSRCADSSRRGAVSGISKKFAMGQEKDSDPSAGW